MIRWIFRLSTRIYALLVGGRAIYVADDSPLVVEYDNISTHLKNIRKPLLSHTVNTITGHGPFRDHLALIKLTDEPSCPKCGANTDSNIHFIFDLLQKDQKKVTEC